MTNISKSRIPQREIEKKNLSYTQPAIWLNFTNARPVNLELGADSIKRCHLTSIGNPIVEIRRSYDRLISTMRFPILVRWLLYIESGPLVTLKHPYLLVSKWIPSAKTKLLSFWYESMKDEYGPYLRGRISRNCAVFRRLMTKMQIYVRYPHRYQIRLILCA